MAGNEEMILEYLYQYNENEKLYKEYYEARKDEKGLREFLVRNTKESILSKRLIFPELYEESVPSEKFFSDSNMFGRFHNVKITKHDRYTPVFEHSHDMFEMIYVLSGKCRQHISGEEINLDEGDICFIALNTVHTMEVFDDSIVLNILIRHETFDDIFLNSLRNKSILTTFFLNNLYENQKTDYIIFRTSGDSDIKSQILDMYIEQFEEDEYCDNLLIHMASILFNKLLRGYAKTAFVPIRKKRIWKTTIFR
ncbi:MAG: AraC family ligand binding domain-containing protein [Eubacteriales bacterium]|nr:AraC family ligand binding domain-containing protein [Eubacteriales bacterium]